MLFPPDLCPLSPRLQGHYPLISTLVQIEWTQASINLDHPLLLIMPPIGGGSLAHDLDQSDPIWLDILGKDRHTAVSAHCKGSFQKCFSGFCPLRGGGYSPFPLSFFEHNDCPLRGWGGVPPLSVKEKIRKKTAIFCQKRLILALFDPFLRKIFGVVR